MRLMNGGTLKIVQLFVAEDINLAVNQHFAAVEFAVSAHFVKSLRGIRPRILIDRRVALAVACGEESCVVLPSQ